MVKRWIAFLFFFYWIGALEAAPFVDASIDSTNTQAHFPLQGTITITHGKDEKIDPKSFLLEGKSLDVSLVKDVKMSASSNTLVTIYSFQLPAKEKGLYVLPAISMKIGGQTYSSSPSSYEVHEEGAATAGTATAPISPAQPATPLVFRLEASVEGPSTLYPGERTKLLYRILYNRSVDLTRSELPMVHPAHFRKVGDVHIKDYQQQDATVQDLTQEIEASEIGTFSFGPSLIEGYAYTMQAGQKVYDPTLLKAEAPVITLEVKPFPSSVQPPSFTGALGKIEAKSSLTSPHALTVGDTLQVLVEITGISNLSEMHLPSLQCQPGFSGFFQTSDIPPLSEVKDQAKLFYVELRPLTALINQIPPIEVSSFDPSSGKYVIQKSSPIPVTITAPPLAPPSLSQVPLLTAATSSQQWPTPSLSPLEIQESQLSQLSQTPHWQKGSMVMWALILALALLGLQKYEKRQRDNAPKPQIPPSEKLFKQALKKGNLHLLEQAFWTRLWEKGVVPSGVYQIDKLPSDGKHGSLYSFLFQLQALQYSAEKVFDKNQIKRAAKEHFEAI